MSRTLSLCLALLFLAVPARASATDTALFCSGPLPVTGRVVIRSGLAWLTESAPIFQKTAAALRRELTARGLVVVDRPPVTPDPMPRTPLPPAGLADQGLIQAQDERNKAHRAQPTTRKATELAQTGKLPPLKLKPYTTPEKDADLPPSVTAITAPDVYRALYARSQQQGLPITRTFTLPGRLPKELAEDAATADYALIVRFAAVRGRAEGPALLFPHGPPGISVAATTIRGVGSLGFGPPAAPAPPGNTYGTPGGYARGYEGSAPNDFWNRDSDFRQRDYQFKYGPQPGYATPPSDFAPGRQPLPGPAPFPSGDFPGGSEWHALVLDLVPLAPLREGKKPESIWQARARKPGGAQNLTASLPEMAQRLVAACSKAP